MAIEQIEIENFRALRSIKLTDLPPLVVVIGANGTGKSTLLDVFSFIKDALSDNVSTAVARRGGFEELVSRESTGPIGITIKFRDHDGGLAIYTLKVASKEGRIVVAKETLRYRRRQEPLSISVKFAYGKGTASVYNEETRTEDLMELKLDEPNILIIKDLGQFREFRVVSDLRSLIEDWHISNFHIADARPSAKADHAEHLSTSGDNVAQVAQYLYDKHPKIFKRILDTMHQRVPGVEGVEVKPTEDGRLVLCFQDGSFKDPFTAPYVSDGTIKMFAYLVLLYDPKPHPLLAVEGPEKQLYPSLLSELIEEFRIYAHGGGQVFVSTHSPDFLSGADLNEIYWFEKVDGYSEVHRASDSELLRNLVEEGDNPSELWRQRLFDGADPK